MERFGATNSGYHALQQVIQEVWTAFDENIAGIEALRQTRWITVNINVPSWSGWDIATSLDLAADETE